MKKLIPICLLFFVFSCMFDVKFGLVGTWKSTQGGDSVELTFKSDDTYTSTSISDSGKSEGKGKYSIDKDIITITPEGGDDSKNTFILDGDKLFLGTRVYSRQK